VREDIIVVKMSGLGSTGPMSGYGTWGAVLNAYSGLTWLWNHVDAAKPVGSQGVFPDYLSAVLGPMIAVSALVYRKTSGTGCLIDLAQSEATAFCALPQSLLHVNLLGRDPEVVGNRSHGGEVQGVYPCAGTDRWCAIRLEDDEHLHALLTVIERDGPDPGRGARQLANLAAARRDHDAIDELISGWTIRRSAEDAMDELQACGVPAGIVASGDDLLADPQLARPGFIRRVEQPGIGTMVIPGLPMRIQPPLIEEVAAAAALGQDNDYVLGGILGLSAEQIAHYSAAGALS
jgi:crotonobetainyl-CoA:carnitine CoA-transferase CaiB-like acyl-CoA transferase